MFRYSYRWLVALTAIAALPAFAQGPRYDLGQPATQEQIAGWDIDVEPSGAGLPPGSGSVAQGKDVYAQQCAACHGDRGQGKPMDPLVGGQGTLASDKPTKTVGSYWPYSSILFDYVRRAMPFNAPQSLNTDQVYAVTAYVLNLNGIVDQTAVMNAQTLPKVRMPNRDGFVRPDPRPDTHNAACMKNCK